MKLKKKELDEIIDGDGNLIGNDGIPTVDANADGLANNTTDYNAKIGTQPFRYDMLGRFGFTMMPFHEGEEKNEGQEELINELTELMHERFVDIIGHYYRNPNQLKPDYRKISAGVSTKEASKYDSIWAKKIFNVVEKHFKESIKNIDEQYHENIAESVIIEDKMVSKKEDEITTKSKDNGVREKKIEKIAGLINKLEKKDIDKIINLLEEK